MKTTLRISIATFGLVLLAGAHASDATVFAEPTTSSISRASVQAETRRAQAAGELRYDDAGTRISAPARSSSSRRDTVRSEAVEAMHERQHGERNLASLYFVGGM